MFKGNLGIVPLLSTIVLQNVCKVPMFYLCPSVKSNFKIYSTRTGKEIKIHQSGLNDTNNFKEIMYNLFFLNNLLHFLKSLYSLQILGHEQQMLYVKLINCSVLAMFLRDKF